MGISPDMMFPVLTDAGASFIGSNCGNGIKGMIGVVREIRAVNRDIPVIIHANAGMPVYRDGKTVYPETPGEFAGFVPQLVEAGASIIGGCCGTTPEHIRRVGEKLQNIQKNFP
jgi:5-methyltetrahydrofolate--homocysteine methyltransferase